MSEKKGEIVVDMNGVPTGQRFVLPKVEPARVSLPDDMLEPPKVTICNDQLKPEKVGRAFRTMSRQIPSNKKKSRAKLG